MKKNIKQLILTCIIAASTIGSFAATANDGKHNNNDANIAVSKMTDAQKEARVEEIKARVEAIKEIDKSTLTKEERKDLKKELRGMQKESKSLGRGGIYISFAGLIIIILLLIIIL